MARMRTAIGRYDRRIELQKLSDPPQRGATGEKLQQWITYARPWARFITPISWSRAPEPNPGTSITHDIAIPYRSDVRAKHRILYYEDGTERYLDIKSVINFDQAGRETRMECTEAMV